MRCKDYFSTSPFVTNFKVKIQGVLALYKGASPPAVGWAAIDSVLMGSLHNYRLFLLRQGMTEDTRTGSPRLTLFAHGIAGLFAGWTRYEIERWLNYFRIIKFSAP